MSGTGCAAVRRPPGNGELQAGGLFLFGFVFVLASAGTVIRRVRPMRPATMERLGVQVRR